MSTTPAWLPLEYSTGCFYLDGHPSRYQPRPTGLNFGEQTGTGVFPLVIAVSLPSLYIITILIHHGQNTFHDQNTPNSKYLLCGISHGKMYIRPMVIYNYRPK